MHARAPATITSTGATVDTPLPLGERLETFIQLRDAAKTARPAEALGSWETTRCAARRRGGMGVVTRPGRARSIARGLEGPPAGIAPTTGLFQLEEHIVGSIQKWALNHAR